MLAPLGLLLSVICVSHVRLCAARYHIPSMPPCRHGKDWTISTAYHCQNMRGPYEQLPSDPFCSPHRHGYSFEGPRLICWPEHLDPSYWPEDDFENPLWLGQPVDDPFWQGQYPGRPGYNPWTSNIVDRDCSFWIDQFYTADANCRAKEAELCKKRMIALEKKHLLDCAKKIEATCSNQTAIRDPYRRDCQKEMTSLEMKLRAECAAAQANAATECTKDRADCKMNQDRMNQELAKLRTEIQALKTREKEVAQDKDKLAQENKELKNENNQLKEKCEGGTQTSEKPDREKNELKKENDELKKENNELKKDTSALQTENSALKTENDEVKKDRNKLQEDKSELKKDISALHTTNSDLKTENSELRKDNNKLQTENNELKKDTSALQTENSALKTENDEVKKDRKKIQEENSELKKDISALQTANSDLKTENSELRKDNDELRKEIDRLKTKDEQNAEKASEDQKLIEQLKDENERLKQKKPSQPDSSQSELQQFSQQGCPSIHGKRATVFGLTYQAFCGARPRGRSADSDFATWSLKDCMAACSIDRSCQGAFFRYPNTCSIRIDHDCPPRGDASRDDLSLVPIVPREGGFGASTPDIPSRLIKNGWTDLSASCPDTDGTVVSVGPYHFRLNCKKYTPRKVLRKYEGVQTISGILAACAVNPACQGVVDGGGVMQIAEHEELPERSRNSELSSSNWVMMLTQARNGTLVT